MIRTPRRSRSVFEGLERRSLFASAGTLLSYDFNSGTPWSAAAAVSSTGVNATAVQANVGTVDAEGTSTRTGAVQLSVAATPAGGWASDLASGKLPLLRANNETNLGRLTLAFQLSATQAKSVKVIVTSYNSAGSRTGALESVVVPASVNAFQRYAVDFSTMRPSGSGSFDPSAGSVSINFQIGSALGWTGGTSTLRVDNVHYARPSLYVSSIDGNDRDSGTTESLAFRTIQKAFDVSEAGDIIVLKGDAAHPYTVSAGNRNLIRQGGTPAAWVTLKSDAGQSPLIYSEGWAAIQIGAFSASTAPAIGYVELRGLHIKGGSLKVGTRSAPDGPYDPSAPNADQYGPYAPLIQNIDPLTGRNNSGTADSRTNGNGISVDGGNELNKPHDIRIADNLVEQCAGGGIGAGDSDRIQIENNISRDNCYWDKYATSGFSILSTYQFEATSGASTSTVGRLIRGNIASGNIHKQKWVRNDPVLTQYSDGNGIIVDINTGYAFRTLVTNNLVYDNGGSGIHAYKGDHVDIINNTAYLNSASPYLQYGQIFSAANDVRIYNNILVAPVANTAAGQKPESVNGGNRPSASNGIIYRNNVYFGGNVAGWAADAYNVSNVTADPRFVFASTNPLLADFRVQSTSPAINKGLASLSPQFDLSGRLRYLSPDSGAFEYAPPTPHSVKFVVTTTASGGGLSPRSLHQHPARRTTFSVSRTVSGATVTLFANKIAIGTATATGQTTIVRTSVPTAGTNGVIEFAAQQTFAGSPSPMSQPLLTINVDSAATTLRTIATRQVTRTPGKVGLAGIIAGIADLAVISKSGGSETDRTDRDVALQI